MYFPDKGCAPYAPCMSTPLNRGGERRLEERLDRLATSQGLILRHVLSEIAKSTALYASSSLYCRWHFSRQRSIHLRCGV